MLNDTDTQRFSHAAAMTMMNAAVLLVYALDHMTVDQFALGADRVAGERLRAAIEDYLQYPWDGGKATEDDGDDGAPPDAT